MNVGYGAQKDRSHWATSAHHARGTALTRCSRHLAVMRVYRWPKPRQIKSAIYHCTVCIVVLDAEKIDHMINLYSVSKVQNVDIGRDRQGEAADRRGARTRRCAARQARQPAQRTGGDRACARALHQGHPDSKDGRSEDAGDSNESSCSSADTRTSACYGRKTSWRQAQL